MGSARATVLHATNYLPLFTVFPRGEWAGRMTAGEGRFFKGTQLQVRHRRRPGTKLKALYLLDFSSADRRSAAFVSVDRNHLPGHQGRTCIVPNAERHVEGIRGHGQVCFMTFNQELIRLGTKNFDLRVDCDALRHA